MQELEREEESLEAWVDNAKKVYFKENFETYAEEVEEILQEHQQRLLHEKSHFKFMGEKDGEQLQKCLKSLVCAVEVKKPAKEKEKEKEKGKTVQKMKKCKLCGSELEYLTEWKKHLVCRTCGGKERNYVPKKQ